MAAHVAAIEAVSTLRLVARADEGDAAASELAAPEGILADPRVAAVAVITPAADREYWVRRATDQGKCVLCELPVVSTANAAVKLRNHCRESGVVVLLINRFSPEPERRFRELVTGTRVGPIVFVEFDLFVPRDWLRPGQQGVVLEYGAPFLPLIQDCLGPIDTIYARTRSLVTNRPQEDVAVAQLRFKNGVEGILQINGLSTEASLRAAVYGASGSAAFEMDLRENDASALQPSYAELARLTSTPTDPGDRAADSAVTLVESLFIVDWIHQSARHDTEVHRREVRAS